jgi:hypothetical protein
MDIVFNGDSMVESNFYSRPDTQEQMINIRFYRSYNYCYADMLAQIG